MGQHGHVLDALAARGTSAAEDQLADELRAGLHDHLGDHAAHREAVDVDALQSERPDADAPVVERDISVAGPPDAALAGELGANPVIRLVMSALSFRIRRRARRRNVTYSFLFMKASGDQLRELTPLIDAGRIRPVVDTVFPFESTREALEYAEAGRAKAGKVVVRMT
jgi:hypothetical protein